MTRQEALKTAKPVLFNTKMVRAIQDGRKTVTRRLIKLKNFDYRKDAGVVVTINNGIMTISAPPIDKSDILYVRETFNYLPISEPLRGTQKTYWYKADDCQPDDKWRPAIHMPKEAARIFLRVTDVRVERLQDINDDEAAKEGAEPEPPFSIAPYRRGFGILWNSTVKKSDLGKYGWNANPWVWVIEFERVEVTPK